MSLKLKNYTKQIKSSIDESGGSRELIRRLSAYTVNVCGYETGCDIDISPIQSEIASLLKTCGSDKEKFIDQVNETMNWYVNMAIRVDGQLENIFESK